MRGEKRKQSLVKHKRKETAEAPREGDIFSPESVQTLTKRLKSWMEPPGITQWPYSIFSSKGCSGSTRKRHQRLKNCSCLWGPQVYKTPAQIGFCTGKSNWDTDNFKSSERPKWRVTADQWEMQVKKKQGQKGKKIVPSLVLKLQIINYKYWLNLKWFFYANLKLQ